MRSGTRGSLGRSTPHSSLLTPHQKGSRRAVSRILSAEDVRTRARERIICLSGQYPGSAPRWRRRRGPRHRSPIWPCSRWGFPCPAGYPAGGGLLPRLFTLAAFRCRSRGGLLFCGTFRQPRLSPRLPACIRQPVADGYAASRPVEFGLSSPGPLTRAGSDSPPFQNRRQGNRPRQAIQGDATGQGRNGCD